MIFKNTSSPNLKDIDLTNDDFLEAMRSLDPSSAPGPDNIPAFFYKNYAEELVYPIMKIWRISRDTGLLPEGTALATITTIYKGGDKDKPANYQPVAITNHLTKIFEIILRTTLSITSKIIIGYNLINNAQHVFKSGRSTVNQLLRYYNSILTKPKEGSIVDSIYLDFAKAFDKVDHNIILLMPRASV